MTRRDGLKTEGHWWSDAEPGLPMPVVGVEWDGRRTFLDGLASVEEVADEFHTKGYSRCRVCGHANGSAEYRLGGWRWPEGFRHYVEDHGVRPTSGFEAFVLEMSGSGGD